MGQQPSIREHTPALVALIALTLMLAAVIILILLGVKPEGIAMLGIAGGIGALVNALSPSFSRPSQSTNLNAPNATTANVSNDQAPKGPTP